MIDALRGAGGGGSRAGSGSGGGPGSGLAAQGPVTAGELRDVQRVLDACDSHAVLLIPRGTCASVVKDAV